LGPPSRGGDGHADISNVYAAAREVAFALRGFTVVVTKSTVRIGTSDEVEAIIREIRPDADFSVASSSEFLREGAAVRDFKLPHRVIIGAEDPRAREVLGDLYRPLYLNASPIFYTWRRAAETDQICRQRVSSHQDHLYQRNSGPL
jgi:UDPglucose 6-dehydrogenase